jgi:uncharacterized protein DUF2867
MRIPPAEYLALDLEAHAVLRGVPLRDVSVVDLPNGGASRTVGDVLRIMEATRPPWPVAALSGMRRRLGRVFHWDENPSNAEAVSRWDRLTPEQRARSLATPGTRSGPLYLVYEFPREMLAELRNATVHAFSVMALRPRPDGYRLYWAIYVERVSALTPVYMAAIEPFRRFVVYPLLLRSIRKGWVTSNQSGARSASASPRRD